MKRVGRTSLVGHGWLILALGIVAGCATSPVPTDEPTAPTRPPAAAAEDVPVAAPPRPGPGLPDGPPVAVVLQDPGQAYLEVLQVFSARLGRPYEILNLAHRSPEAVRARLRAQAPIDTVALAPAAFDTAATIPGVDLFYAGVLDPGGTTQGIDALPPFGAQLDYWLALAPDLKRLGVIGGASMAGRMTRLAEACAVRGIELTRRQVSSDTEMLLAFRSLVPHIDGFVFLPDDEVLSPRVIRQVLNHGSHNGVQMLVYSPVMFNLGGTLYLRPDPVRVAEALVALIHNPRVMPVVTEMRSRHRLGDNLRISAVAPSSAQAGL